MSIHIESRTTLDLSRYRSITGEGRKRGMAWGAIETCPVAWHRVYRVASC